MANFVKIISILGVITDTVKTIEARSIEAQAAGESPWTGEFKRELAVAIIREAFLLKNPGGDAVFEAISASVRTTISTIVATFNLLKIFVSKKS